MNEIDPRAWLAELGQDIGGRRRVNISVNGEVWDEFQEICGRVPASNVLEKFIIEFIERARKQGIRDGK